MTAKIVPFSLKDAPSLIEHVLPSQKLSAESYKEQMSGSAKMLTSLGSYWKGRKPLVLNRACVLGALLPARLPITFESLERDLEIFEMLMSMDEESFVARWRRRPKASEVIERVAIQNIEDFFIVHPPGVLPSSAPVDLSKSPYSSAKVEWRNDIREMDRRRLEAHLLPAISYRERVELARRTDEIGDVVAHSHIWDSVNQHLGTNATSIPELVEQLGIMRFGRRPRVGDAFCGSGQIPFEAARLGCDTYASDLNPIACMLTWGAFNVVGASADARKALLDAQDQLVADVTAELDSMGVEQDRRGRTIRGLVYCAEVKCPETGWMVPLLPSRILSVDYSVVAELVPDPKRKRYDISVRSGVDEATLDGARKGTLKNDGRGTESYLVHQVEGIEYRTKVSTLRGDYITKDGCNANRLRLWRKSDFRPSPDDVFQERLYAILWALPRAAGKPERLEFRAVTPEDLTREGVVEAFVEKNLSAWQKAGYVPELPIEPGYNTDQPIRERGWTHWHHLFNPRQLVIAALARKHAGALTVFGFCQLLNWNSRLSQWNCARTRGYGNTAQTFYNQALNTFFTYGTRGIASSKSLLKTELKSSPLPDGLRKFIGCSEAASTSEPADLFITDPPYGDAVNYDEILEYFIAWLAKKPLREFADWTWDSRRALAIKGEDDDFRRGMVTAYSRLTQLMPDNGLQIIMFTHQSGSIWADMANIVWASGLQVTAAWYVVTETDSALREGSYVKGTVLLVLRKRLGEYKSGRDDLAWEIQDEVLKQVETLTGLNQSLVGSSRTPNQFSDADLQMAGYAAALRVLTRFSVIDGRQMAEEAVRPRQKGVATMVDELIEFAVGVANNCLVPAGLTKPVWDRLRPAERFYLKLLELEASGAKTIDNYQNFSKAFKVDDFKPFMASMKANGARLKSAAEFGRAEMSGESELANSPLRGVLYALMELQKDLDGDEVLQHLSFNVEDYFSKRPMLVELSGFLAKHLSKLREEEASAARVLHDLIQNQRL